MDYRKIVVQWNEFELPKALHRDINVALDHDFITTITGPRRAGKTYLCFQVMESLLEKGVAKGNILYVNFEDEKLLGAAAEDLEGIMDAFYELSDINKNQKIYLFLDEVQAVRNWDAWIRRMHDMKKGVKMVVTGSSSKLLSREISTRLRGRVVNIEVFPLSFREYLQWKNVGYDTKTVSYSKERFAVKKEFDQYLLNGGYPAIAFGDAPKEQVLQSYFQSMIFRDVVERHSVKEIKKLKILISLLFESVTKEISYSKLSNRMKSLGFKLSKNTIIEYISYFEDAYLFFQNLKYEYSTTKQLGSMKKVYCIDNGLLNSVSFRFSEDTGKLLENLVFIEMKRRRKEVYFNKENYECDFLVREKSRVAAAIQATKELDDENRKREVNGLLEAMEKFGLREGVILTAEQEDEIKLNGKKITVKPVWKWLLE